MVSSVLPIVVGLVLVQWIAVGSTLVEASASFQQPSTDTLSSSRRTKWIRSPGADVDNPQSTNFSSSHTNQREGLSTSFSSASMSSSISSVSHVQASISTSSAINTPSSVASTTTSKSSLRPPSPLPVEQRCQYLDYDSYDPTSPQCNNGMPTIPNYLLSKINSAVSSPSSDADHSSVSHKTMPEYHRRKVVPDRTYAAAAMDDRFYPIEKQYIISRNAVTEERRLTNNSRSGFRKESLTSTPSEVPSLSPTLHHDVSEGPTVLPTDGPTVLPTEGPTVLPMETQTLLPVLSVSSSASNSVVDDGTYAESDHHDHVIADVLSTHSGAARRTKTSPSYVRQERPTRQPSKRPSPSPTELLPFCTMGNSCFNGRDDLARIVFLYTGKSCGNAEENNDQSGIYTCLQTPDVEFGGALINVVVVNFDGTINDSDDFAIIIDTEGSEPRISITLLNKEVFDSTLTLLITDDSSATQQITLATSCNEDLMVYDVFGSLSLSAFSTSSGTCQLGSAGSSPTLEPDVTEGPTVLPTEGPTLLPLLADADDDNTRGLTSVMDYGSNAEFDHHNHLVRPARLSDLIHCDFSFLAEGVPVSDVDQRDLLEHSCRFTAFGADLDTTGTRQITVSTVSNNNITALSNTTSHDCVSSECDNQKQVKALLLQVDGDEPKGGCMNFEFEDPVDLYGMQIVGLPEHGAVKITLTDSDGELSLITSLELAGGHYTGWWVNETHPSFRMRAAVLISICSPVSSAVTCIDFFETEDVRYSKGVVAVVGNDTQYKDITKVHTAEVLVEEKAAAEQGHGKNQNEGVITSLSSRLVHCDFEGLTENLFLSNVDQSDMLQHSCGLFLFGADYDSTGSRQINVLDGSNIVNEKWDLGSPHSSCGGNANVTGSGGKASSDYANCHSQGKIVYVDDASTRNSGGCMNAEFQDPVDLIGMGLLNLPEEGSITVTMTDADGVTAILTSPDRAGPNSFWAADDKKNQAMLPQRNVVLVSICSSVSTGLAYLDFYMSNQDSDDYNIPPVTSQAGVVMENSSTPQLQSDESVVVATDLSPSNHHSSDAVVSPPKEESTVSCGPGIGVTGFYLVDRDGNRIPNYEHLHNGQIINGSTLPRGADLVIHHDTSLGAVKYESEQWGDVYESNFPYRINHNNLHHSGRYTFKAYGYSDAEFSTLLNICEITFEVI